MTTGEGVTRGAIDARKLAEIQRKLTSLADELTSWAKASEAGASFEKHHTQIRRIALVLDATRSSIEARLDRAANSAAGIVTEAYAIERLVLEVHRIWQFYREKLTLRRNELFQKYLAAADDFAWACYAPVCEAAIASRPDAGRDAARARFREPPLTFLNGGSSPFTMTRGSSYEAEHVPDEPMTTREFTMLLRSLPVPVIGVPWFQLAHLPDALVIGHEVAHDLEEDLALTDDIEHAVTSAVPPTRRAAWKSWSGEIFADVFGVLAGGSAFVGTLVDFLVTDPVDAAAETRGAPDWGLYPTVHLRALIAIAALHELDGVLRESGDANSPFAADAARIGAEWETAFGREHAMTEYARDVAAVVQALMATEYRSKPWGDGKRLCDVIRFDGAQQKRANHAAANANAGLGVNTETDVRCLMAAARLAFERKPDTDGDAQALILDRIMDVRTPGVRADGAPARTIALSEPAARDDAAKHDARAAIDLFAHLAQRVGLRD